MQNRVYAQPMAAARVDPPRADEDLMRDLARGQQEALGPLYSRYAALVFHLCVQTLDRPGAEELVQEVFLTIWRGAGSFDPSQGAFRPWLLRLTHWKILNELRRRRRRPAEDTGDDGEPFEQVADQEPGPEERAWQSEHERIVKSALESLPPKQRQAVSMAFLEDMTHEQVASALDVPLGTAKTRIRSGLQILRLQLAPIAASLFGLGLAVLGFRYVQSQIALDRDERALTLVTTSDLAPLRLTPAATGVPAGAHANYRSRAENSLAVLTVEALPSPPAGSAYQAWVRHASTWTSLGSFSPQPDGSARLIAENPALAVAPDALEITLEPSPGSATPTGTVVLAWSTP
ncbi:MAG TPA: sigma-70 family RNA polymerase sigma factor [Chloroflexota bacterium]|nr:sigma-70 family RNA polymerase sigma factor [Chloroflexota bacterium]